MTSAAWISLVSLAAMLLLAAVGYLIKGMFATGDLTRTVKQLSEDTGKMATKIDAMQKDMLTQTHLDNTVLKLKLELIREGLSARNTREMDKMP